MILGGNIWCGTSKALSSGPSHGDISANGECHEQAVHALSTHPLQRRRGQEERNIQACAILAVKKLAVQIMPESRSPGKLCDLLGPSDLRLLSHQSLPNVKVFSSSRGRRERRHAAIYESTTQVETNADAGIEAARA